MPTMTSARDGWYIADSEGYATGPMSREQLVDEHRRGLHAADALAWHVEYGEWRPLERIAAATSPETRGAASARVERAERAERAATPPPSKAERKRAKAAAKQQLATAAASAKRTVAASVDDGRRRLASAPAADASRYERVATKPAVPAATAEAAAKAAASGARAAVALRRFLARVLDTLTLGLLGAALAWSFVAELLLPLFGSTPLPTPLVLAIAAVAALIPIEALALAVFGTTPAKALLGLSVAQGAGGRADFARTLRRAFRVAWRGVAFGIPFFGLITVIVGFVRYVSDGRSSWDRDLGLEVRAEPIAAWRWQAAAFATFLAFLVLSSGFWSELATTVR